MKINTKPSPRLTLFIQYFHKGLNNGYIKVINKVYFLYYITKPSQIWLSKIIKIKNNLVPSGDNSVHLSTADAWFYITHYIFP